MKALERTFQVVNELGFSFCSQSLALYFNERGKNLSQMALVDTPLSLMVSHFVRNLRRCIFGFLEGCPLNCSHSMKVMSARLNSKLLASIAGLTMEEMMPDACAKHSPTTLDYFPRPSPLLFSSFFLLICPARVQLLRSPDWMGQGFDSLNSSCACKTNTTHA